MRKIISFILCVLMIVMIGTVICGCDNSMVTITVDSKYENEIADKLATDKTIDEDGNTVYTFTKPQYLEYLSELMEKVKTEFRGVIADTATYSYLNEDGTDLVVGVDKAVYEEAECKNQAERIGNIALVYNASTLEHTGKVEVTYENCFTGEEYFKSDILSHNAL